MRIVFFGTPQFALPSLRAIHDAAGLELAGVMTQPDRPAGRGKKLKPSPVKELALELGLEVLAPEKPKDPEVMPWLEDKQPDAIAVVAYGGFVPKRVRELPPHGCVNLHPSLLPRYRGAAPMQWAIMNGDAVTGNSTMYLSAGWDDGDVIYQEEEPIGDDDTYGTLSERLSQTGAALLVKSLLDIDAGTAPRTPQPDEGVVMAPMINNEDTRIDWSLPARDIFNRIRGMNPIPGAFTECEGQRWKLLRSEALPVRSESKPGTVVSTDFHTIRVAAGEGVVELLEIQPAGKRPMKASDYLRGHPVPDGAQCQ